MPCFFVPSRAEFGHFYEKQKAALQEFVERSDLGAALLFYTTVEMVMPPPPTAAEIARAQERQVRLGADEINHCHRDEQNIF